MQDIVIALAKAAILVALNQPENFNLKNALQEYPMLQKDGAAFVTINKKPHNSLRGCIGSLEAHRPLYKDIISNAQSAALRDPRFKPLTPNELKDITVEVSILSTPKKVHYLTTEGLRDVVVPHRDGIVLKYKGRQATYLPQVWEQLPQFDLFFSSLCQKAKLDKNCLSLHPDISVYHVTKYKE